MIQLRKDMPQCLPKDLALKIITITKFTGSIKGLHLTVFILKLPESRPTHTLYMYVKQD